MSVWSVCLFVFSYCIYLSIAKDTIRPNDVLRENQTLVSAGGVFELGFFHDSLSGNVFAGIWFKDIGTKKPVWVANRNLPLEHLYATLLIRDDGNLIVTDRRQSPTIVNYGMLATSPNTSATLLDTGNLILQQGDEILWQSFHFPTDTYLPGMKLGWFGMQTDQPYKQFLCSWLSPQNPSPGDFILGSGYKDARTLAVWRSDSLHMDIAMSEEDGYRFIFKNSFNSFNLTYTSNANDTYLTFNTFGGYDMSWLVMASTGHIDEFTMYEGRISLVSHSLCDVPNAVNSSVCLLETSQECVDGNTFMMINGSIPSPMAMNASMVIDFDDCEFTCWTNCSCIAFNWGDVGCQLYYGDKSILLNNIASSGEVHVRSSTTTQQQGE